MRNVKISGTTVGPNFNRVEGLSEFEDCITITMMSELTGAGKCPFDHPYPIGNYRSCCNGNLSLLLLHVSSYCHGGYIDARAPSDCCDGNAIKCDKELCAPNPRLFTKPSIK